MPVPPAYMGYVGFVKVLNFGIRCTSCELKLTQAIEKPDVVSAKYDKTVYKLGPKEIGGTISFPAVMESVGSTDLIPKLWELSVFRNTNGYLLPFFAEVRYSQGPDMEASFMFDGLIVNSFKFSVAQGDMINIEVDTIGRTREAQTITEPYFENRNARALTWNDAQIVIRNEADETLLRGEWIRNFEVTVANNAERYYTMNRKLAPQDVAAKLRDITGSLTIMGRHPQLAALALLNETKCYENSSVQFGYEVIGACNAAWGIKLPGVVFEFEQMGLKNDLFETTVAWHSLPGANFRPDGDPDGAADRLLFRNDNFGDVA